MNEKYEMISLKLTRGDVYNLLLATMTELVESDAPKWRVLHDKIWKALDEHDKRTKEVKAAIFGVGCEVTDEMWRELKDYAEFIKQK